MQAIYGAIDRDRSGLGEIVLGHVPSLIAYNETGPLETSTCVKPTDL